MLEAKTIPVRLTTHSSPAGDSLEDSLEFIDVAYTKHINDGWTLITAITEHDAEHIGRRVVRLFFEREVVAPSD